MLDAARPKRVARVLITPGRRLSLAAGRLRALPAGGKKRRAHGCTAMAAPALIDDSASCESFSSAAFSSSSV